jgi:hypothetical protein
MVFLDECNHNRFNDVWTADDSFLLPADLGRLVSRPDHRKLANEYIGGVFRAELLGHAAPKALLDGTTTNTVAAKAAIQWSFGRSIKLLDNFNNPGSVTLGTRTLIGATVSNMAAFAIGGVKVAERTNHQTGVLVLEPNVPGPPPDAYKLVLSAAARDWSGFELFIFRVCADADVSNSGTTGASPLPDFTWVFTDTTGASAVVTGLSLRTPNRPRPPVFHEAISLSPPPPTENCTVIRMETLAVDLSSLAGVDRTKMAAVMLVAPVMFDRHQFFDSFQLVKR